LLRQANWQPTVFFYNPNIQPRQEHDRRLCALKSYCQQVGGELLVNSADAELWIEMVGNRGGPFPLIVGDADFDLNRQARLERCTACYQLRMQRTSEMAREQGFAYISSTLLLSPYQFHEHVQLQLADAAVAAGKEVYYTDWRPRFSEANRRTRALGLYRQNYCGCAYSQTEANLERAARKAQRQNRRAGTSTHSPSADSQTLTFLDDHAESKLC
jgi:predicted adenine nucleotide alpha hydrolase (AANH) superfamily ATPase